MCVMQDMRIRYSDTTSFDGLSRNGIFSYPFKNFGRLDNVSKMVCYAAALALKDAGDSYSSDNKKDMGIIGTNTDGSLESDIDYFKDYLVSGRKLSRGNLFIYTLPTSPLAEAAIHFGLQGPLFYMTSGHETLPLVIRTAEDMLLLKESQSVVAGINNKDEAMYFVFKKNPIPESPVLCDISKAMSVIEKEISLLEMAEEFLMMQKGKC
ncbi:MAG: hypothetical protein HY035_02300 [Nitrospirae bacterium]|nr:hypothetical protein [Nitrospirota bacterium]